MFNNYSLKLSKAVFCLFVLVFVVSISNVSIAQQKPGMDISNLSAVRIDDLSDEQLIQIMRQGSASGFTIEQGEQMAIARGLPQSEVVKLRQRLSRLGVSQINSTESPKPATKDDNIADSIIDIQNEKYAKLNNEGILGEKATVDASDQPVLIYGQQVFRNSGIKIFERSQDAKAPDNYTIGVGDEIGLSVFGYSYYNEVLKVDARGAINPAQMGPVFVKGLSFDRAKTLIRSKMSQFYDMSNNRIEVTLAYSRSITVNIVGEVMTPGSYNIPAINTAFNALIAAGGPSDIGTLRSIEVRRAGKVVKVLDVYAFLNNPDSKQDYFLENNDYIVVGTSSKVVAINGEVKRPFRYELLPSENLLSLLKYAGGLTSNAFTQNVQVIRTSQKDNVVIDVNIDELRKKKTDFKLNEGDLITVRSVGAELTDIVEIKGSVNIPGVFNFKEGDRVSNLIFKAGGLRYETLIEKAFLVRSKPDLTKDYIEIKLKDILTDTNSSSNLILQKLDVVYIVSNKDYLELSNINVVGAVRKTGQFEFSEGMTLGSALLLAGGLKTEADNLRIEISRISYFSKDYVSGQDSKVIVQSVQVPRDLRLTDDLLAFKLQPFDQVFVRTVPNFEYQQNITLQGEVKYPGQYTILNKNEKISDVIRRSGGLTNYSFPEGASFYRPGLPGGYIVLNLATVMKNKNSKYNYTLKAGDILTIPTTIDFIGIRGTSVEYLSLVDRTQVNAPFVKGRRAKYYINEFGNGFTENSWRRKTYVIENNSKINKTKNFYLFKIYPKVRKGSTIYVVDKPIKEKKLKKESEPFNWNRFIENTTLKITGLATIYILLRQL